MPPKAGETVQRKSAAERFARAVQQKKRRVALRAARGAGGRPRASAAIYSARASSVPGFGRPPVRRFFTENQNIAGFDNPGKSLYTTIRELVENSLDAAESIGVPPTIEAGRAARFYERSAAFERAPRRVARRRARGSPV